MEDDKFINDFIPIDLMSNDIDILDDSLYSFDNVIFYITPAIKDKVFEGSTEKIDNLLKSIPSLNKAWDYLRLKTKYIPAFDSISDEIKGLMKEGKAEMIPCKKAGGKVYLQIRTAVEDLIIDGKQYGINRKITDIPLRIETVLGDLSSALQCLSLQNQLNQISQSLTELSLVCERNFERIMQGQRDDRFAKLLTSRSSFLQGLIINDIGLKKEMLINSVKEANTVRAELSFQIKADINSLVRTDKLNSKEMSKTVSNIYESIIVMNNAVQISLYSYQTLGEHQAQLAVVKEQESFIRNVLMKEIESGDNSFTAWELIRSSCESKAMPDNFSELPNRLLVSYSVFIDSASGNINRFLEEDSNETGDN